MFAFLLAPVVYSYATTMVQPSSLPIGIRSVEWLRANHGAWLVNSAERAYYSWQAPKPGGPELKTLPTVGSDLPAAGAVRPGATRVAASWQPAAVASVIRPRLPGEGVWQRVGPDVAGGPPLLATTFRPDPVFPRIVAYVAWIDHRRTQLALYPGRYEPPNASPRGPMQVPAGQRWRLLATFNSGFTYGDGHGGFSVNGSTYQPLLPGQGTLVAYRDRRVDIVAWHGGPEPGSSVVLARQNLPLIVDHGKPNPQLADGSLWGATLGNAIRVWRSGVGIDRHGNLVYVAANDQTAQSLAAVFVHLRVLRAIELDINAEWPSFITYRHAGALTPLRLVPNTQQTATRYLTPDDRDFFAIYRLIPRTTALVPFS